MNTKAIFQGKSILDHWEVSLYFLALCSIVFHVTYFESYSEVLTFSLLLLLGCFIFRGENQRYFLMAFSLGIAAAVLQGFIFYLVNGKPFAGGGDDEFFYNQAVKMMAGKKVKLGNYAVYLYINYSIYSIGDFLGFTDMSYLNIGYSNAFVGATIAPCINNIAKKFFDTDYTRKTVYYVMFFPIIISYSGLLLRDIWVAAIAVWIVYITLSNFNMLIKILLIAVCFYLSFGFRAATAVVSVMFFLSYLFYGLKNFYLKFTLAFIAFFIFFAFFYKNIVAVQDLTTDVYVGKVVGSAGDNSVGSKFVTSNNPVMKAIYFVIILYNPVPPFRGFVIDDLFVTFGAMMWYFIIPGFILGLFTAMKDQKLKRYAYSFATSSAILLLALFSMFGNERHKLMMYPIAIFFYIYYLKNYSSRFRTNLMAIYCLAITVMVLVYATVKLQLL
ncbi:MAG: hypothetical protein ACO3EE_01935 [Flavobacteriales bacterium]